MIEDRIQEIKSLAQNQPHSVGSACLKLLAQVLNMTSAHLCRHDFDHYESVIEAEYFSGRSEFFESQSDFGRRFPESGFPNTGKWLRSSNPKPRIVHIDEMMHTDPERSEFMNYQVKTALLLKIMADDAVWGYIELWNSRSKRVFTDKELDQAGKIIDAIMPTILAQQ